VTTIHPFFDAKTEGEFPTVILKLSQKQKFRELLTKEGRRERRRRERLQSCTDSREQHRTKSKTKMNLQSI
jgi:hypothetical protein